MAAGTRTTPCSKACKSYYKKEDALPNAPQSCPSAPLLVLSRWSSLCAFTFRSSCFWAGRLRVGGRGFSWSELAWSFLSAAAV